MHHHITEVYSPPRVTAMAKRMSMIPGFALDLTQLDPDDNKPWDFNDPEKAAKAKQLIKDKKALLVIGSPMCSAFSQLQSINFSKMTKEEVDKVVQYGTRHLEFCIELYNIQINQGLYFLHEHPWGARSWKHEGIQNILNRRGVQCVCGDMCTFGMLQSDEQGEGLIKKMTGFMTNPPEVARELNQTRPGNHRHIHLFNGRAAKAQVYPEKLCKAMTKGLMNHMKVDGRMNPGEIGSTSPMEVNQSEKTDEP